MATPDSGAPPRWVDGDIAADVASLQYAGHSGGHRLGLFEPSSFSLKSAARWLEEYDSSRGCAESHLRVEDRADAIGVFKEFVYELEPFAEAAEHSFATPRMHAERVSSLLGEEATLAALASKFAGSETDAERCLYFSFFLYRRDGTAVHLLFDYTH